MTWLTSSTSSPRAAMSVATNTRERPPRKPSSVSAWASMALSVSRMRGAAASNTASSDGASGVTPTM